jgi:HPt (histidine-containing phosphotransfer) domain-containing protein
VEQIEFALLQFLPLADTTNNESDGGPIQSIYWQDQEMQPLILTFLKRLADRISELDAAQKQSEQLDTQAIKSLCLRLKGSAGSYGFPQITQVASKLLTLANDDQELWSSQGEQLIALCRSACQVSESQ